MPADAGERGEILAEMLEIWDNNHPWFAIADMVTPRAYSKDIVGYENYADGNLHFEHWSWK